MDKTAVLKLTPRVLKRMEYNIERFYLLNLNNDELWVGNYSSYLVINALDGFKTIEQIVKEIHNTTFSDFTTEALYKAVEAILQELLDKHFLVIVKNKTALS